MNDFHPLVSIVIPVYNGSNYLQCAIDSALGQDYSNIEVIVVNDGSKDNTEEIAKSYGGKIRYFSKKNGGVSTALNLAIRNARGEYISWLSHDDYYLPNKISRQIEELSKIDDREKFIVFSDARIHSIIENQEIDTTKGFLKNPQLRCLTKIESLLSLLAISIHGCTLLIPTMAFEIAGFFDESLITTQDYDLWTRFVIAGYLFYCVPDTLLVARRHQKQDSITKWRIAINEELRLCKFVKKAFAKDVVSVGSDERVLLNQGVRFFKKRIKRRYYGELIKSWIPKQIRPYVICIINSGRKILSTKCLTIS